MSRYAYWTLMAVLLASPAWAGGAESRLLVRWIDVEGGAATLIVTPVGESVLVDTGFPGGRDSARILEAASRAGLRRIDHVIVTHLHRDHFGGLAELAEKLPIGTLYENGIESAPERERGNEHVPAFAAAKVGRRVVVAPGDSVPLRTAPGSAPIRLRFLGAQQKFVAGGKPNSAACAGLVEKEPDPSDNANSVVSLLELGRFRLFLGGDLTWNTEGALVCPLDRVGAVDVFQIDHHGLDVSNNPVLLRTLRPTVVVFNNGPTKGCQPGSFAAAKATASVRAIYQVHRNLADAASNTEPVRIANAEADCAGRHLELSVDPKGNSYVVTVPSTGHAQTFAVR